MSRRVHSEEFRRSFNVDASVRVRLALGAPRSSSPPWCGLTRALLDIGSTERAIATFGVEHPGVSKMELATGGVLRAPERIGPDQRSADREQCVEPNNLVDWGIGRDAADKRNLDRIDIAETSEVSLIEQRRTQVHVASTENTVVCEIEVELSAQIWTQVARELARGIGVDVMEELSLIHI